MADKEIEKLKKEIEKLKKLVNHDELTGLYNRRGLKEESTPFLKETASFKKYPDRRKSFIIKDFALVIFDIDDFKKINDTYGHPAGDKAIQFFSDLISKRVRVMDLVARWGGEEIVLGLPGASLEDAYNIAEDIRSKLSESSFKFEGKNISFTISGGVAGFQNTEESLDELVARADQALYKAKESGKNKIVKSE